jgi:hypothetical protein
MLSSQLRAGADPRTPITMWELLIWAYKRQMVRYEVDRHEAEWRTGFRSKSPTWRLGAALALGGHGRGSINGAGTTAHEDAHIVHAHVMQLEPANRDLIIRTAERGSPPDPNPVLPPCRVVPVRKGGTGSIRMLYGKSGRPIACLIDYEGIPDHEARQIRKAACLIYSQWWDAMRLLHLTMLTQSLTRWKVERMGVDRDPCPRSP